MVTYRLRPSTSTPLRIPKQSNQSKQSSPIQPNPIRSHLTSPMQSNHPLPISSIQSHLLHSDPTPSSPIVRFEAIQSALCAVACVFAALSASTRKASKQVFSARFQPPVDNGPIVKCIDCGQESSAYEKDLLPDNQLFVRWARFKKNPATGKAVIFIVGASE